MKVIYRYKTAKPADGHFAFMLHAEATVLSFSEHWGEKGWELIMDVLEDTRRPKERRNFFLCNGGDKLDFLGDFPEAYFIGLHETKSYMSYVFETTHLSESERLEGKIEYSRFTRQRPELGELSFKARQAEEARRRG